jgi:choline kinase|tara:strand:+ start:10842 stop:11564 length:723 start_codon:yes stop_codon:yes gene_type:complete
MSIRHTRKIKKTLRSVGSLDILIPAAGLGKRMKSYGPKSLITIKYGQSILERQLYLIDNAFKDYSLVLVCGFQADKLMELSPPEIIKVENELYEDTNVCRSIGLGLRSIPQTERLLIINGDLVFTENTIGSLSYDQSCVFVSNQSMGDGEVGCIINSKNNLENLMYDLPTKWCQIAYFEGEELEILKDVVWDRNNKKLFTFEVINKIIDRGGMFKCVDNPAVRVVDVDTSKDIKRAKDII